ncbi:hypothetical protein [Coxiella burnetii]|uniref:Hypothetical exported protein n=1 Tax=Coxiella burnetii (strain Dugway 5J108-111) TaxID=434922 RepID=A9KBW6_COXBN|nr:hypothetical protein [Coxiella burnetii]ABS77962.1 hypothetical exported protein [Coxiella burnetii Dugway 5J108-111]ACJ19549.1 hypothetical exported protein [Coxiella burnetii CbuK_Q154]AIT62578.1 putative exported protein [Coxiella burnetii str. Namibia]ATN85212.1 hypothetical protein AYO29_01155 [Coxiella burnetii str. Schperling]EAX32764.1 hypothetical protein A35_01185 [Coxiella burnetii 'MSU Goat Q177']
MYKLLSYPLFLLGLMYFTIPITYALTCPNSFKFTCRAGSDKQHTMCKIHSSVSPRWHFVAPDEPISGMVRGDDPHSAPSVLPPGKYRATYSMALYEKIKRLNGMNAYCYYTIFGSLVGLYNVNYRNDLGKEWTRVFPGYICNQAAGNCQFIHK